MDLSPEPENTDEKVLVGLMLKIKKKKEILKNWTYIFANFDYLKNVFRAMYHLFDPHI
jgi:hypothetical protein